MDQPDISLRQLIMGFRMSQLVYVAAKLGVADELEMGPRSANEVAEAVGADAPAMYRLLRALASAGVLHENEDRKFQLTATGSLLRTAAPGSLRDVAMLYGEEWVWRAYSQLLHSVRTGEPAFPHAHGLGFYEFLEANENAGDLFNRAMTGFSRQEASAILDAYDFSGVRSVVDVGAGHGTLLATILQAHSQLTGIAFDLPKVIDSARESHADVASRLTYVSGDFFHDDLPAGADLYMLKSVLHNWDDRRAVKILKNCRRAMQDQSRLLVIERVIPPGNEPSESKLFDINMLVVLGGRERTEQEYRSLLSDAGLTLSRAIPTRSPLTVLEAIAA